MPSANFTGGHSVWARPIRAAEEAAARGAVPTWSALYPKRTGELEQGAQVSDGVDFSVVRGEGI